MYRRSEGEGPIAVIVVGPIFMILFKFNSVLKAENKEFSYSRLFLYRFLRSYKPYKKEPPKINKELLEIENQIHQLEEDEKFSSQELADLIFKRAEITYSSSNIDDYEVDTKNKRAVNRSRSINGV